MGYVPLPFFDVFAKVGVARLTTNINTYVSQPCTANDPSNTCGNPVLFRQQENETKAAYGGGVQAHFLGLAVRGEYERISSAFGDPDAFTVSATWTF